MKHCIARWSEGCQEAPLIDTAKYKQKAWDSPKVLATVSTFLSNCTDPRLAKGSGLWLNTLPVTSLGLHMDNLTIRMAIGLYLGLPLCRPHSCYHRGCEVTDPCCQSREGCHHRHASVNDIIHAQSNDCCFAWEPSVIFHSDRERPDGITMVPWQCSKCLVWDATCPDTYAPVLLSYCSHRGWRSGQPSRAQKNRVTPISIETSGVLGSNTLELHQSIAMRTLTCFKGSQLW